MNEFIRSWLLAEAASKDTICVKRIYIDINDGNLQAGVLFSQIMYWHGFNPETGKLRLRIERDGHLWLAKGYADWWEECRINERTARQLIADMVKRGLLIKKVYKFDGVPMVHIRVDFDALMRFLSNGFDTVCQMEMTSDVKSITETTTETTNKQKPKEKDSQQSAESAVDVKSESGESETLPDPISDIPEAQPEPSAILEPAMAFPVGLDDKEINRRASELIHVWLDRQDALNEAAYKNTSVRAIMRSLVERGVHPKILQRFIRLRKQDDFWHNKFISADHIAKNLLAWMKSDAICRQITDYIGYEPYITVAQQAELDAQKPKPMTEAEMMAPFDPAEYGMTPEELAENMARKDRVLAAMAEKMGAKWR